MGGLLLLFLLLAESDLKAPRTLQVETNIAITLGLLRFNFQVHRDFSNGGHRPSTTEVIK